MDKKTIALLIAKERGYDLVDFQARWNDYDVFSAGWVTGKPADIPTIGLPLFILVDNSGAAHIASDDEWSHFAELLPE